MGSESEGIAPWANVLQGQLVVRTLAALGVRHFYISPGSRSSPLAVAMEKIDSGQYSVVLDERSAAFRALGHAKAVAAPVALICTSGTAAAHYYPAVIEARETGIPLIILTADRPPELRCSHAGQTIDQLKLYSGYPVFHAELPLPQGDSLSLRQVREICRVAVEASMGLPGGPVHLNCPYREPFFPREGIRPCLDAKLIDGLSPVAKVRCQPATVPSLPGRTLILAGPAPSSCRQADLDAMLMLARKFGWPILADGASPLRYMADQDCPVMVHYDRVARDAERWQQLKPEAVLSWGEPPTSKELRARLSAMDIPGHLVSAGKRAINPTFAKLQWICSNPVDLLHNCTGEAGDYSSQWMTQEKLIEKQLSEAMLEPHPLFEGDIVRLLETCLPDGAAVFFAGSLAIRDAEWFMPSSNRRLRPFSQRGANGIDGTVSLSRGIAQGLSRPTWLLAGDLAFLHDANGLAGAAELDPGLFVVLVNNNGGGIFEFLPVANNCDLFEQLFATPQPVDMGLLAGAYGCRHALHQTLASLESHMNTWNGKGLHVAEVRTDRKLARDLHRRFLLMQASK